MDNGYKVKKGGLVYSIYLTFLVSKRTLKGHSTVTDFAKFLG